MSEANVIQLNNFEEDLLSLAIEKRKGGNVDGALSILLNLEDRGSKFIDIFAQIAKCYMEINLNVLALKYWYKFLNYCPKNKQAIAFNGLGACYYYLDEFHLAGFYFEKQINLSNDKDYEFDNVMLEYYDELVKLTKPEFSVCYPPEKVDTEPIIEKGDELFFAGKYAEAINTFELVLPVSENYGEAQLKMATSEYYNNQFDVAKERINRLIAQDIEKIPCILTLIGMLLSENQHQEALPYFEMIENEELDVDALSRLAPAYCEIGRLEKAKEIFEKVLEDDFYDINSSFLLGLTYYNLKEFGKAKEKFVLCYTVTRSPSAKYYVELCSKMAEDDSKFKTLEFTFNVDDDEAKKRFNFLEKALKGGRKFIGKNDKNKLLEYVEWAFSFDSNWQKDIIECLLTNPYLQIRKYFIEKLLDQTISDNRKTLIIEKLVENGYNKRVGVVFGGIYTTIELLKVELDKEKNKIFTKAYARAFSLIAPVTEKNQYKLCDSCYKLYYALKENGNIRKITDVNALAAAIAFCSGLRTTTDITILSRYFNTKKSDVFYVLELAGVDDESY